MTRMQRLSRRLTAEEIDKLMASRLEWAATLSSRPLMRQVVVPSPYGGYHIEIQPVTDAQKAEFERLSGW